VVSRALTAAPALTVRQAASRIVARQVRDLLGYAAAARRGDDPEAIHQMRVQTRRLRAARALFADVLRVPRAARVSRLRWIAGALGRVRDLDVVIALLEERHLGALEGAEAARLEDLLAALKERRWRAQQKLAAALARRRWSKLKAALKDWARHPKFAGRGREDGMAARFLTDVVHREAVRVSARRGMTERAPTAADLHGLRIRVKRLRYVLDFHAETCGVAFDAERALARQIQDCLGEIHDHDVVLGWFAAAADSGARGRGRAKAGAPRASGARRRGAGPEAPVEAALLAGAWPVLPGRLAADRERLLRRFLRLRGRWRVRTDPALAVAALEAPRFVNLEAAPVQLRIATPPLQKTVASLRLVR
jgi:CHAD domain-containing protein